MCATERPSFANLLRSYRVAVGLSQERLAELAGLSVRAVSDLERGVRRSPRLETARMLADALALGQEDRTLLFRATRPSGETEQEPGSDERDTPRRPGLPIPATALIGREREIDALSDLLTGDAHRLVTLVGPGGVGKTHLALEVARLIEPAFPDGACFVRLASLSDTALVAPTTASTLGIHEPPDRAYQRALERTLATKRLLLVMDNFEHVASAAPMLSGLLSASPGLRVLATSRTPLRLSGEYQYPVSPLELPHPGASASLAGVAASAAVRLFVTRAQEVRPDFGLTEANVSDILAICQRLDGLPLALELAAGRVKLLTPGALLGRLDRSLSLLTGGPMNLPERQRTLRGTIAWSHDLLAPEDQRAFHRLAVFVGGWTLESATFVVMDGNEEAAIEAIGTLVDASLVHVADSASDEPRYLMRELVREFALEQLEASGEAGTIRDLHARYCISLAARDAADMSDEAQESWLARLGSEQGNIRAALAWLLDRRLPLEGLELVTTLGRFWGVRGGAAEGRAWAERFLDLPQAREIPAEERIAALRWAGEMSQAMRDTDAAQAYLNESVAWARRVGDRRGLYEALGANGAGTLFSSGDVGGCIPLFREAIALARDAGDSRAVASMLAPLAWATAHQGDVAQAEALLNETLNLAHSYGAGRGLDATIAIVLQGWLALMAEDNVRAAERLSTALDYCRRQQLNIVQTVALAGLGEVALVHGKHDEAAGWYREGLSDARDHRVPVGIPFNLQGLVRLAHECGNPQLAARLIGGLDRYDRLLHLLHGAVMRRYESAVDQVQQSLGDTGYEIERSKGVSTDIDQLVRQAMAYADTLARSSSDARRTDADIV